MSHSCAWICHRVSLLLVVLSVLAGAASAAAQEFEPVAAKVVEAGTTGDFNQFRQILASPSVNTPEPFQGFGGWCGWPDVCRLQNGDLFVVYSAGYWHASWPTPLDQPPEMLEQWKRSGVGWIVEWDCPTGGKMVWIRSRDNGKTWTRPKAFPIVPGCYYISDVLQLRDGTMLAAAVKHSSYGWWERMPATPMEFAKVAARRFPAPNVIFRSDDNGDSWREIGRISDFPWVDAIYSMSECPDGSVLAPYSVCPLPGAGRSIWVCVLARSEDQGKTWATLSVLGSNEFDSHEALGGYLPDGSIGLAMRPRSTWYRSLDHGRTWSEPQPLHPGSGHLLSRGSLSVTPDGVAVLAYCGGPGGSGRVIYSRDSGNTWMKTTGDLGFQFDPFAYYPDTCVLDDGTIFAVGSHEGLGQNQYGPAGAEVTAMRFRIKTLAEGEGIELLPIGGPPIK
ncbi:MAG: hypothetical protein A2V98_03535 [Planctomycetes bacterium RBG_16_64_12]|nr:MAG: hypothetical protein A2V98_03535 [Planctomycetes bacterium RBG_16_64_12]